MKKIISLLMSIVMLVGVMSGLNLTAYASTVTSGKCGSNITWNYDKSSKILSLSGSGTMEETNENAFSMLWESFKQDVKTLNIGYGITSLSNYAFSDFTSLTEVSVPSSVTYMDYGVFSGCTSLKSISLPSLRYIQKYEFMGCTSLTSVSVPSGVEMICDGAFLNCSKLDSISIPTSVTSIGFCSFDGSNSLKDVYYSGLKSQWNKIKFDKGNAPLLNANIHFAVDEPNTTLPSNNAATTVKNNTTNKTVKKTTYPTITSIKGKKKRIVVSWTTVSGASGYNIQFSTNKNFKKKYHSGMINSPTAYQSTLKQLKSKKKYYVRIRSYKKVKGKYVYSKWSKVKSAKTK
ncbi:MAG: leucine-rich repeat domain-containing protein [Clostridia bacterium]|nr:leucine-rich repeat domain-containing protein [Clostridia bacterium]